MSHSSSSHHEQMNPFGSVDNKAASVIALGIVLATTGIVSGQESGQETPPPQETVDPNIRYATVVTGESLNLRAQPRANGSYIQTVDNGTRLEVSRIGVNVNGHEWVQVWEINDVPVESPTYAARTFLGELSEVPSDEAPAVAAPEPEDPAEVETQPASTDLPQSESWVVPTPEIGVTPQMTNTEESIAQLKDALNAEGCFDWDYEVAQELWIGQGDVEVGPFSGLNPVLFINTQRAVEDYGTLSLNDAENSTPPLPFLTGGEMSLSGLDAWRLSIYQVMAHNLGIETQEEFELFMQNLQPGEYEGTFRGYNPVTGVVEDLHYDPAQPVTVMNMGLWRGNENIRDEEVVQEGIWNDGMNANQLTVNENGGLVIRFWMLEEWYQGALDSEQAVANYPEYSHRGMEMRWYGSMELAIMRLNMSHSTNGYIDFLDTYNSIFGSELFAVGQSAPDTEELYFGEERNGVWPYIMPGLSLSPDSDHGIGGPEIWPFNLN